MPVPWDIRTGCSGTRCCNTTGCILDILVFGCSRIAGCSNHGGMFALEAAERTHSAVRWVAGGCSLWYCAHRWKKPWRRRYELW